MNEYMSHLYELKKRLLSIFCGLMIGFVISFPISNNFYMVLAAPLVKNGTQLITTNIVDPLYVSTKLSFILALFISLPNTLFHMWRFLAPAMYKNEKRFLVVISFLSIILFMTGAVFCYYIGLLVFIVFIKHFQPSYILLLADINQYLSFVLSMIIGVSIAFETPVALIMLIKLKILSVSTVKKMRSYIFIGSFVIAAILAPPDVISQCILAIILYLLYEGTLFLVTLFDI